MHTSCFSQSAEELFLRVLQRLDSDLAKDADDEATVGDVLSALVCARQGLAEPEIMVRRQDRRGPAKAGLAH